MRVDCSGLKIKTPALARVMVVLFRIALMSRMWELFGSVNDENVWSRAPISRSAIPARLSLLAAVKLSVLSPQRKNHSTIPYASFRYFAQHGSGFCCYELRFVGLTAGDQAAPDGYLFSALMLVPVNKPTKQKAYSW